MASARKTKTAPREETQLQLLYSDDSRFKYWESHLFNEVYLRRDISEKHADLWDNSEDLGFQHFINTVRNLAAEYANKSKELSNWSETETINNWVKFILDGLGWKNNCTDVQNPFLEETSFRSDGRTFRTDILIVDHPKEKQYINQAKGDEKLIEARNSVLMPVEVKYWQRLEEFRQGRKEQASRRNKDSDELEKTSTPNEQIVQYMGVLKKDWSILTDGAKWRLFNSELSSEDPNRYYEFNLYSLIESINTEETEADRIETVEAAKYFYHFFSKFAFYPSDESQEPFVSEVLRYSKKYVNRVEEDLKHRFVKAMNIACNGFHQSSKKAGDALDLKVIRNVAESTLFNVLFIKSLESRAVLPMSSTDYKKISISNTIDKIERFDPDKEDFLNIRELDRAFRKGNGNSFKYDPKGTEIHDRVVRLTMVIHEGSSTKDRFGFEISGFKESVFSTAEWTFFKDNKLSNHDWVKILFQLGYTESESKSRKYQQIPYSYFTPRQLGSIYESFLEFKLDKASKDMIFEKKQWKEADLSSKKYKNLLHLPTVKKGELFFTPDNEDRKASGSYYTPDQVTQYIVEKTLSPIVKGKSAKDILKIKVCDPAMGSGHFLAASLNYLAAVYTQRLSAEATGDLDVSFAEIKQQVLNSCIYGVDLNPRAVKLAKLSLWLESASLNKKLEHLDDQLKNGDSILEKENEAVSSFAWSAEFAFLKKDKFDAIVGNPPYIRSANIDEVSREKIRTKYKTATSAYDIYVVFFEKAMELLKEEGRLGFIVSNKLAVADYAKTCREMLVSKWTIDEMIDFTRCEKIFKEASVVPIVVVASLGGKTASLLKSTPSDEQLSDLSNSLESVTISEIIGQGYNFELFHSKFSKSLLKQISAEKKIVGEVEKVRTGIMGFEYWKHEPYVKTGELDKGKFWKLITPGLMTVGSDLWSEKEVRLYKKKLKKPLLMRTDKLLSENTVDLFNAKKVVIRGVGRGIAAYYDTKGSALLVAVHAIETPKYPYFMTALFNSTLVNWIYCTTLLAGKIPQGSLKFPISFIESIPVKLTGIDKTEEKLRDALSEGFNLEKIDKILCKHYGITAEQFKTMQEEVRKTIPSGGSEDEDLEEAA